jgi:ADP-ribose pyrophosphatase YjhB (NUDIX family)
MKREYPDLPLVGVGAVIVTDAKVVLVKRGTAPLLGEWSIPGGVLELGETLRQAVAREALEETGLAVEPLELLGVFDRVIRDEAGQVRYHYVLIDFLCREQSGELRSAGDAAGAARFSRHEINTLPLADDTRKVILAGFEKAG